MAGFSMAGSEKRKVTGDIEREWNLQVEDCKSKLEVEVEEQMKVA